MRCRCVGARQSQLRRKFDGGFVADRDVVKAQSGTALRGTKKHYFYQYVGRGERIRTFDPLHPMQVRYQAALRPDRTVIIATYASLQLTIEHRHDAF